MCPDYCDEWSRAPVGLFSFIFKHFWPILPKVDATSPEKSWILLHSVFQSCWQTINSQNVNVMVFCIFTILCDMGVFERVFGGNWHTILTYPEICDASYRCTLWTFKQQLILKRMPSSSMHTICCSGHLSYHSCPLPCHAHPHHPCPLLPHMSPCHAYLPPCMPPLQWTDRRL